MAAAGSGTSGGSPRLIDLSFKSIGRADDIVAAVAKSQISAGKLEPLGEDVGGVARGAPADGPSGSSAGGRSADDGHSYAPGTMPMSALGLPEPKRVAAVAVKLANNKLASTEGIAAALARVVKDVSAIKLLDLSFNSLEEGVAEQLRDIGAHGLMKLYLHGNGIKHLGDAAALAEAFPELHTLAMHGCPVREHDSYRQFIISTFPRLRKLDFTPVTPAERDAAESWRGMTKVRVKKV